MKRARVISSVSNAAVWNNNSGNPVSNIVMKLCKPKDHKFPWKRELVEGILKAEKWMDGPVSLKCFHLFSLSVSVERN